LPFQNLLVSPASAASPKQVRTALTAFWARAIRPAWVVIGISACALAILCSVTEFDYASLWDTVRRFGSLAVLLGMAVFFAAASWPRTALILEGITLLLATLLIIPPLESIFASAAFPFQDDALLAIGRRMGIDWVAMAFWFRDHAELSKALSYVYASIEWQPPFLIAALACADPERLRRTLSALALTLAVTMIVFLLLPAIGPYENFKFSASDFPSILVPAPWVAPVITEGLRNGSHQICFAGLVTFPSYHAAAAFLYAYGWAAVPVVGLPFVILNAAMLVSCVPIGSHYLIDVIVGIALAFAALRISDRYFKASDSEPALDRWDGTPEGRYALKALGALPVVGALLRSGRDQTA
jgi:membrane-associated phospholipid phosphatase